MHVHLGASCIENDRFNGTIKFAHVYKEAIVLWNKDVCKPAPLSASLFTSALHYASFPNSQAQKVVAPDGCVPFCGLDVHSKVGMVLPWRHGTNAENTNVTIFDVLRRQLGIIEHVRE